MDTQKKSKPFRVETHDHEYKRLKHERMFFRRSMFESEAYRDCRGSAVKALMIFLTKCQMKRMEGKPKRQDNWYIGNNGAIEFPYDEAEERGIAGSTFGRALDELIRVGFIDIEQSGYGVRRIKTLYRMSDRWKLYNTDDFVKKERQKRDQKLGQGGRFETGSNVPKRKSQPPKRSTRVNQNGDV